MRTNPLRRYLLSLFSATVPMLGSVHAQNLTQSGFTSVITPQFMASGTSSRMPVMFRATVSGLSASTTYRYFAQGATNSSATGATIDFGTANSGAGNPLLISASGSTYTYTTGPSLTSAGNYETFTTDASGNYTGWFGFVNSGNGRFTAGNLVFPSLTIGNSSGTLLSRRALDVSIKVLAFSASAGANNGSFLRSTSSGTAKNLAVVYENTAGTGRPLAITPIESIATSIASVPAAYTTTAGTWNVIIPNNNANGVRRIEQRSVSNNTLVGFSTDADGSWPTGPINTVNPTNNTTALVIAGADAPLVSTPSITGAATASAFTTTYGTASSAQTFAISGSSLAASLVATAPSGFEVSADGSAFGSTASFAQTGGNASGTLSIRLSGSAPVTGSYDSQNITLTSTGATTVNIATAASGNSVSAKALTVTANNATKLFGATLTGGAGSTAFGSSGLVGSETIGSVTISYGAGASSGDAAGTYAGAITPSAAVGGSFISSNYSITYVAGDLTVSAAPTISTSGTLSAVSTTYGTASTSPTSFLVSGGNLTGDLSVTPPAGFEVSTSSGSGYSGSLSLTASGGTVSSTTIYVRLSANAAAASYSGDIGISGGGATTQTVATASSTVAPKNLTITGLAGVNREYDASLNATLSGTAVYAGLENSESFSVAGIPVASFATKTVGTAKPITVIGYEAPSANYTVTQPTGLTADVTAKALTIASPSVTSRPYNGTLAATITGTLDGVISPDAVTLVGTGSFADANVANAIAVTSTSTLAGADSANYSLSQPIGLTGDITQAAQTITFAALPGKSIGDAPFALTATATSGLAVGYSSSNPSVATIAGSTVTVTGIGTTTISANQAGDANYSAATQVDQVLTVSAGPTVLAVGDLAIIGVNSANPDKFAVVLLKDITASTVINFTDNGFDSATTGRTGEGFLTFTAPTALSAGTVLSWNNGMTITGTGWSSNAPTSFAFNGSGDQLFAFQGNTANWASQSGVTVLCGINYGVALTTGTAAAATTYQPNASILPSSAFLNLPSTSATNNYFANGSTAVASVTLADSKSALFALFETSSKWFTSTSAVSFPTYSITFKTPQTISFGTLADKTFGDADFALSATASSGLSVSYASSNPSVATISGNTVQIVGAGTTTITASQSGDATYGAAVDVPQTFTVGKANQTITGLAATDSKTYGDSTYSPSASSTSGLSVAYASSNTSVATVSGNIISIVGAGTTTITASQAGDSNYNPATSVDQSLTVVPKALTITASDAIKPFGTTWTGGSGSTAFTSSGLVGVETIGSVTITYGSGAAAGDTPATYADTITASDAVGGTFTASNYSITYVPGDLTVSAAPSINTLGSLSPVNSIYGSPSSSPTSFSVSGANLTGSLSVAAPTGFEVSTSIGSGYSTSLALTATSGTVSSTPIYVRLSATSAAATYSGNVTISGGGATSQTVATASSTVAPKELTITGLSGVSRVYDGSLAATLTGTASYVGLENSESFSVAGTPVASFVTRTIGTAKALTVSGYAAPSANYTVTQPTGLTADITEKALTLTSAAVTSRPYNATLNATVTGTLDGIVSPDVVTLVGTGTFADANVGTGIAVTSTSTLSGADSANYTLTQPTGLSGDITQASQTITFAALPNKSVSDSPFSLTATASSGLAVSYSSSNNAVATVSGGTVSITGVGTTTITASQTGNSNYSAATPVDQILTVTPAATTLAAGDIAVIGYNTSGTPDNFAILVLKDLTAGTVFYVNDNEIAAAGGTTFTDLGEGEASFTVKSGQTIPKGTVIILPWGAAAVSTSTYDWSNTTGFGLGNNNEEIQIYTASAITSTTPTAFIYSAKIGTSSSARPSGLTAGTTFISPTGSASRYKTSGATYTGTESQLLTAIGNTATNWEAVAPGASGDWTFTIGGSAPVTIVINDVSVTEGNSGTTTLNFTVTRSDNTTGFTVDYATADGTATQPGDYTAASGTLTFTAGGALTQPVSVTVLGDTTFESDETVLINLSNVVNSVGTTTISDTQGIGTILNDEPVVTTPLASGNRDVLVPNTDTWPASGITVNGTQFVNLGLQGVGRIPANAIDPATGESLGSISDLQVSGFTKNLDGTYSGTFNMLPDRGYNNGAIYSNYAARINAFSFTFTPYTSSTPTTEQNQVAMTFTGSTRFTYDHDGNSGTAPVFTTGLLADGSTSLFGTSVPIASGNSTQSDGTVSNRLTLDSEGLALDNRSGKTGSGWIGDEYGGYIYHFNAAKQLDAQLQIPAALVPHSPTGTINFQADPPTNGRRINQGMEGLAQSPDGTKLFGLLQSATLQDSGSGNQGRSNTRLLVYDVSSNDAPSDPVAQYLIQLPRVDDTGSTTNGSTVNRNAAQSAILALNDHQLLILSREGNGRGAAGAPVFKSILLADLSNATNIDGLYDAEGNAVAPGGVLSPTVTPISWTEALNLLGKLDLNIAEVAKFGLNLNTAPGDINTICEKWEALSLVSCGDAANPNDYFLFVGNDNDFISATGKYMDASGAIQSYNAGLENDTMVLAYRVRIVQPQTPVNTWRLAEFGTTSTTGNLADNADYDNDGIQNLVEYALGTDPTVGSAANGPSAAPSALIGDADSLLTDRLALSFSLQNPNPTDITYTVQATDDLGNWTSVASKTGSGPWTWLGGGTSRIVTSGTGPVSVKIGDVVPSSGNPKRMMRLKVANP